MTKMYDSESTSNELGKLKDLDELLKCGICYEYFKTTLMTPCSHNYCSYCIRQSLLYRNQCPACFEDTNESQLRNNRVVDEFISIYSSIQEKLLKYISHFPNRKVFVKKYGEDDTDEHVTKQCVTTENSNEPVMPSGTPTENIPSTSKKEIHIPAMFSPKKTKHQSVSEVKVSCPVCSVEIPEKNINFHLDACLKRSQEKRVPHKEKRKPLPKLVYNLLPDKELRKRLGDLGLSTIGDRKTLINRHKRYTVLYNSECDSLNPKSVPEIIKQLKKEEEEEKKVSIQAVKKLNVDRKADPKVNEEAQRQYLQEHKFSFQKLIEEARRNQNAKKNSNKIVENEACVILLEESSSEMSESEFRIKRPIHKRKLITSDSEDETNEDVQVSRVVTQANINCHKNQTQEILKNEKSLEKESRKEDKVSSKTLSESVDIYDDSTDIYDDSTDEVVSIRSEDEKVKDISPEVSKKNTLLKKCESNNTLQQSVASNLLVSVTSPILGTKCRQTKTPTSAHRNIESFKRDLTPSLLHEKVSTSSPCVSDATGHQGLDEDSDCSSNHSTSLMMYTGPDCDYPDQSTPIKTPCISTPTDITTPVTGKSCFDLGIEEILQNTEDFMPLPIRRQSRRIKETRKNTPVREPSNKRLRKRVRIDDL